ncbi:MAG: RMD1 family protein [Patescibacteria group bacterium]|jgi:uncharacterized Rmd1/YagE family protein
MATKYQVLAYYVRNSLDLAKIEQKNLDLPLLSLVRKERNLLVYQSGDSHYVCVYAFGVVTVCGIEDKKEIAKLLKRFAYGEEMAEGKDPKVLPEDYAIMIEPEQPESVEFGHVQLKQFTLERFLLISHVMAQSVAIDFVERRIAETQQALERIHGVLEAHGKLVATNTRSILKTVGMSGNMVHFMVTRLSLLDKPDIAWEDKDAEALFLKLRSMFELDDRFEALRFKLEFIKDSSEMLINIISTKRAEFMEVIIIVLIAVEILLAMLGVM